VLRAPAFERLSDGDLRFDAEARTVNAAPAPGSSCTTAAVATGQHPRRSARGAAIEQVTDLLRTGKANVLRPALGARLQNNFIMVEVPIASRSGRQYVIGQASPDFFIRSFAARAIPPSWRFAVFDAAGVISPAHRAPTLSAARQSAELGAAMKAAPAGVLRHHWRRHRSVRRVQPHRLRLVDRRQRRSRNRRRSGAASAPSAPACWWR
jgi:hypothetical protein